jgi:hypothetical protein
MSLTVGVVTLRALCQEREQGDLRDRTGTR